MHRDKFYCHIGPKLYYVLDNAGAYLKNASIPNSEVRANRARRRALLDQYFGPKREPDPSAIILFHHFGREIRRILEDEHEHYFLTSAFRLMFAVAIQVRLFFFSYGIKDVACKRGA